MFTVQHLAHLLLSACLPNQPTTIGENWVNCYIQHHPELESKYTQKYDYQCAKCEDPELIQSWFTKVHETIQKHGILAEDIYNMDETGCCINVTELFCTTPQMIGLGRVIEENEGLRYKSFDEGLPSVLLRLNAGHCKT